MKQKQTIKLFLKGMAIGIADLIPGVSGGTVALVLGVYERLIRGIRNIGHKSVCNTILRRGSKADKLDLEFLIPLFAGIGLSFVTLSYAMLYFLGEMASPTFTFLFVVILGSSVAMLISERLVSLKNLITATAGFIIAFILVGLNPASMGHSLPILVATGALVIVAMILPGISGALVLLLLGLYEYFFDALHALHIVDLLAFGVGAAAGLLGISHFLHMLLERHRVPTIAFLIGITLGSLRLCYQNIEFNTETAFPVFFAALMGAFILTILHISTPKPKKNQPAR